MKLDIEALARQAHRWAQAQTSTADTAEWFKVRDKRFAHLVAAAVKEEAAKLAESRLHAGDAGPAIIVKAIRAMEIDT